MKELTKADARHLLDSYNKDLKNQIPDWFKPEHLQYLFPVKHRPTSLSLSPFTPSSPEESIRTSVRRDEDEARRKAMHDLVTNWDKAARSTSRSLVDHLFRGVPIKPPPGPQSLDMETVELFHSLIPDSTPGCSPIVHPYVYADSYLPVHSVGGYSVTDTVGPLSMLSRVCRSREIAVLWIKEKVRMSHGKRTVKIKKREGTIVLFDRYMNIVFIPRGRASDRWEFIRGSMIALVQVS